MATAFAQIAAAVIAWLWLGAHVFVLTLVWVGLWLLSASLYREAAERQGSRG